MCKYLQRNGLWESRASVEIIGLVASGFAIHGTAELLKKRHFDGGAADRE
jgi:hypothetical protein